MSNFVTIFLQEQIVQSIIMIKKINLHTITPYKSIFYALILIAFFPKNVHSQGYATTGWNVSVFHEGSDAASFKYYNFSNYLGYYTTADDPVGALGSLPNCTTAGAGSFSFNTNNDGYTTYGTPTLAPTYTGLQTPALPYPNDGFTIWAKKTNFTCGYYKVYMQSYDDGSRIKIDQDGDGFYEYNNTFSQPPCTPANVCQSVAWEGFLGTGSKVDIQCFDWYKDYTEFKIHVAFLKQEIGVTASNSGLHCPGNNISLTAMPIPNPNCIPVAYSWSGPDNFTSDTPNPVIGNATAVAAGTYTVAITASLGACGNTPISATTTVPLNPLAAIITVQNKPLCEGKNITLSAQPSGAISYQWSGPNGFTATTQTASLNNIKASESGNYTLSVTQSGCSSSAKVNLNIRAKINLVISANANPVCPGTPMTFTTAPGNFSTYDWNPPLSLNATLTTIAPATSTTYKVTATDPFGCPATSSYDLTVSAIPPITITGNTDICLGQSTTLTASVVGASYLWSNGATTQSAVFNQTGLASVTVTNGICSSSKATIISQVKTVFPKITASETEICRGRAVVLTASGGANFAWSNGDTLKKILVTPTVTTTYILTISDATGCKDTTSVKIKVNEGTGLTLPISQAFCEGDSLNIVVAPSNLKSYVWSNGVKTFSFFTKVGGLFSVSATDANNCISTKEIQVTMIPNEPLSISGSIIFCTGKSTTLTASDGFNKYLWSNGATSPSIVVNTPGVHRVSIVDMQGCKYSTSVTISEGTKLKVNIKNGDFCAGNSATLNPGKFKSYLWSDGSTAQTLTVSKPGKYCISVSDGSCDGDTCLIVNELALPTLKINGKDSICDDTKTTLSLNALFTKQRWSFGNSQSPTIEVGKGTYNVTVTAANGCTASDSFNVTEVALPKVSISGDDLLCPNEAIALTCTASGNGLKYLWNTNETTAKINTTKSGNFSVIATNSTGCEGSASFKIAQGTAFYETIKRSICQGESFVFRGKTYDKNRLLDTIIIQSHNLCDSTFYINTTLKPTGTFDLKGAITVCSVQDLTLSIDSHGYAGNFDIEYSANDIAQPKLTNVKDGTTIKIKPSQSTIYKIIKITLPPNACTPIIGNSAEVKVSIVAVQAKKTSNFNGFSIRCGGGKDGAASVETSSGATPFKYLWSNGTTTPEITAVAAGNYSVTVTDAVGCSLVNDLTLNEPKALSFKLLAKAPICGNPTSASILIDSIKGGISPLTYSYSGNNTVFDLPKATTISGINGGDYTITVSDANTCTNTANVKMPIVKILTLDLGTEQTLKLGDSIQLTPITNFVVKNMVWSPKNYLSCTTCKSPWSKPFHTVIYTVKATDSLDCMVSQQLTLTVDRRNLVYIPTAFSPNDDGTNDKFVVYGSETAIVNIKSFRIFDRWGDQVFEQYNFKPNDDSFGWDGTFRGTLLNPQVLTYAVVVTFIDGEDAIFKGDFLNYKF
jgi:gliding motility-associated-like protein